jgi:DNA polymerase
MFINFLSTAWRMRITLSAIEQQVSRCQLCPLYKKAHNGVPGEGNPRARIFLVGQAPGAEEDKTGKPFVGRAGKFLTKQLNTLGILRKEVFITSVVKHFPPANRMPNKDEVSACKPYLLEQIELVNPEVVVLMGALAQSIRSEPVLQGRTVLDTPHPAAAMRFPKLSKQFGAKMAQLKQLLK